MVTSSMVMMIVMKVHGDDADGDNGDDDDDADGDNGEGGTAHYSTATTATKSSCSHSLPLPSPCLPPAFPLPSLCLPSTTATKSSCSPSPAFPPPSPCLPSAFPLPSHQRYVAIACPNIPSLPSPFLPSPRQHHHKNSSSNNNNRNNKMAMMMIAMQVSPIYPHSSFIQHSLHSPPSMAQDVHRFCWGRVFLQRALGHRDHMTCGRTTTCGPGTQSNVALQGFRGQVHGICCLPPTWDPRT